MKTTLILLLLGFSFSSQASTFFEQLCAFNPNWSKYRHAVPMETERVFLSDKQYIQSHLEMILEVLKSADTKHLTEEQFAMRTHLMTVLSDYRLQGNFPINYYRAERIPVFIDEHNTHCAVGYLMKETGYENLALKIAKADNYIWVKDLKDEQVLEWQQLSGFSLEELKLIQGAYDSYMPFALEAPNRIEIPQKPEVIALNFKQKDLVDSESKTGKNKFWIRGEGKEGVLHGRWEQNYSPALPWIVGFYQNGKREGKWLEYYQGTDQLCRTEHWKNDKLNGIRTRFDRSGNVIEEILFENGNAVLKTNYDLGQSLKYVRKPLGDNKVWTEIYDMGGQMLASGHETIHNPGNLQWFQNIELTALNTISLASQNYTESRLTTGSRESGEIRSVRLYDEPPLVEYIKQGDWSYYEDVLDIPLSMLSSTESPVIQEYFRGKFMSLVREISLGSIKSKATGNNPGFDSLKVNFSDGNVNWLNRYTQKERSRIEFEWFTQKEFSDLTGYIPISAFPFSHQPYSTFSQLKSYGFVNENDEKINKWYYFDAFGQLSKVEEFIKPQKKDITLNETRSQ